MCLFTIRRIWCILNPVISPERQNVEKGFEQDRQDYWAMRDELLIKYPGKWVAVHKGRVVCVADEPLSIMEQALAEDGYAYTNKVGDEDKIVIRQRRVSFPYDATYSPTPLPRIAAVIDNFQRTKSKADGPIKRAILGENNARLSRFTPQQRSALENDRFAQLKKDYEQNGTDRSNLAYGYIRKPRA